METHENEKNLLKVEETNFIFNRGSDPRVATCRGKLQNKRSKLNLEINKELRLRAGAENLFRATSNRKLKETVALELSFVNSNLQLLKEQLAELNSSVEIYQGESSEPVMPMIPLGLKETKEIDFSEPFKDFILEHYSEEGCLYEDAIAQFMDMRQSMRSPQRDPAGIALLLQYYNQLYFVERRFFPPDRTLPIYFEWYDSLTGVPSCQRTVAFEKACVLFNTGALYTQVGTRDRAQGKLESAVDNLLQAAGTFSYLAENFTNAPTMDLQPQILTFLSSLMMAQARECLYEKLEAEHNEKKDFEAYFDLAQEAAQLVEDYKKVEQIEIEYVPESWKWLVQVKAEYYAGVSLSRTGQGLLAWLDSNRQVPSRLPSLADTVQNLTGLASSHQVYTAIGVAYLKAGCSKVDEASRRQRMCRELRNKKGLDIVLREALKKFDSQIIKLRVENHLLDLVETTMLPGRSRFELVCSGPDFGRQKVEDLFSGLGPLAVFSAKHYWTAPRTLQLHSTKANKDPTRFGFSISTDCPVVVTSVQPDSLAKLGGIKEGDYIVAIGDIDVKWSSHDQVVKLIKESGETLSLKLVTPMDKQNKTPPSEKIIKKSDSTNVSPTNSGSSSHKKLSWNPFKKYKEREAAINIILR